MKSLNMKPNKVKAYHNMCKEVGGGGGGVFFFCNSFDPSSNVIWLSYKVTWLCFVVHSKIKPITNSTTNYSFMDQAVGGL